jgi:hypothetical protein
MTRSLFAMVVAALLLAFAPGTSQAAPIAPPTGVESAGNGSVTQVYYWYHRHHRHCWRGRYHWHCY